MVSPRQVASPTSPAPSTSVLHPIQRIHTDILAEIFTHCLPERVDKDWRPSLISGRKAPLLLCKVCASWRSLAISTPRLWQMFILELNAYNAPTTTTKSLPSDIRTWLGRSGTLPLTIRFLLYTNTTSLVADTLKAVFESSSRWESVLIETTPRVPWPPVSVLPNLRDFHGSVLRINEFPFTSAPSLKSLSLYTLPPNPTSVSSIPWNRLTELSITTPVPTFTALELFQGCPLLEKLSICVESSDDGGGSLPVRSVPRIKQDALRWFWLYITPGSRLAVENLTLPALEELHLGGISTIREPYCYSQLLDLFTRSKCKLQKLTLMWSKFKPDQLLEYLKHPCFRTLTSLTIEEQDHGEDAVTSVVDKEVLSQLTYSEEQGTAPLCPKLAELVFKMCYRSEVSPSADSLGRMVRSRCFGRASDEQLKSLELLTRYPISSEDNELLELARDKGGLRLSYASGPKKADNPRRNTGEHSGEEHSGGDWSEEGSDDDWVTEGSDVEWEEDEGGDSNEEGAGETTGEYLTEGD
ncbi:hypothetical protein JOM56_013542 [Amanita muscaria]